MLRNSDTNNTRKLKGLAWDEEKMTPEEPKPELLPWLKLSLSKRLCSSSTAHKQSRQHVKRDGFASTCMGCLWGRAWLVLLPLVVLQDCPGGPVTALPCLWERGSPRSWQRGKTDAPEGFTEGSQFFHCCWDCEHWKKNTNWKTVGKFFQVEKLGPVRTTNYSFHFFRCFSAQDIKTWVTVPVFQELKSV